MRKEIHVEQFFLTNLLRISIGGLLLILLADLILYPQDTVSLTLDVVVLSSNLTAYLIRKRNQTLAVLTVTGFLIAGMFYQSLLVPVNTTTALSILLLVGFILSVMIKDWLLWLMHGVTFSIVNIIFIIQWYKGQLAMAADGNEAITIAVTYSILYFILGYATYYLKSSYDQAQDQLREVNLQLAAKANEVEAQNEELIQIQENLSLVNEDLEKTIADRTENLRIKTEKLIKYSYTNAHHLRGPVARLLGLVAIRELEENPDNQFFFTKVKDQAEEIDTVVKQINRELENL